ncbi:MAG: c-type cytochrome [Planctomycetes bacterium]|nr:c-type cytochrome [Planctomycetota bacterium]
MLHRLLSTGCVFLAVISTAFAQREFGFVNTKPSGQPYLNAEECAKRFKLLPGWEVKVFAAEPDIVNPIAFTVDERGRLWVVENFEYPRRTPKGQKPRDRIKILEDTDGDGKADKVTTWAEGKDLPIGWDLASGIEVGHGGVFLGAAPYLFFLSDTKNAGKCDKQEILLKGFGSQDTHETLNTLQWGPDSKLYGLHGVFTHSDVDGVKLNAAVWRYDVPAKKFDIFAEGTSNPWGMDFDSRGQCFLACCVIPHLFHMVPGGTYKRQAGGSFNPYAFGLLNEACDHVHHKESGWAHAGLLVLEGDHVPEPLRGSLIMGSIHGCSIKRDVLRPNGSTFIAGHAPDFAVSGDKNFRPINIRWGPDGSIYVIDWHDQNPCHQAHPESWDKTHGRIYKIQRKGAKASPPRDLGKLNTKELVTLLTDDNPYRYRTALRLLSERQDPGVASLLRDLAFGSKLERHALRGLWGLYAVGAFDSRIAVKGLKHANPWFRSWTIRFLGEANQVQDAHLQEMTRLASDDPAPQVRLQLASTAQRLRKQDRLPLLHNLMKRTEDAKDPFIPLMIWLAYEPCVIAQRSESMSWLKSNVVGNALTARDIAPRVMRRLAATHDIDELEACVDFLAAVQDSAVRRQCLDALVLALKNRKEQQPPSWKRVFAELGKDADPRVGELARRLAVNFQDPEAIARALAIAADAKKAQAARIEAIHDLALSHPPGGLKVLQELVAHDDRIDVRVEACRALGSYEQPEVARDLLARWKALPERVRAEGVTLLTGRKPWAKELLAAVGKKAVPRRDLHDNHILRILAFKDQQLVGQVEKVWGHFRKTPADLQALIDRMRGELHAGRGSFERGRKVFDNQCAKCHKFDGRGHEVGPNLDGAARDIEYLLANILDPNRVVGQPYYTRIVELKNGRIETGLLLAEDDKSITLKGENDVHKVILKKNIDGKVQVQDKSIMPEGLANNMTAQDFRDLIRYTMAHPFLTEVAISRPMKRDSATVDPAKPDTSSAVWTWPAVGPAGRIPLASSKKGEILFVAADVEAPAKMTTRLLVGAAQPLQIWLNGKRIYSGQPGAGPPNPDQAGIDVELQPGANTLVIQADCRDTGNAVYARLLDPERRLRYPEGKN